ncbi:hypothetical protein MHBO_003461 [Bonamia ostreae]|uniref:PLAC8 family protein n=1 Tax=Bonamia ostreae TaxID=126728 RepID=A0ABV2AQI2_9EUKA
MNIGSGLLNNVPANTNEIKGGEEKDWDNGMCSCCDDPLTSLMAYYFPCVIQGRTYAKLKDADSAVAYILIFCLLDMFGFSICAICYVRMKIREQRDIKGSKCGDCMAAWMFGCCTIVQSYREL